MNRLCRNAVSTAIAIAAVASVAQAEMVLVPDATSTPAQVVIVPFYYAEAPYTTTITLTNHGSVARLWAMHFKEAENGREVLSCCASPNILPGASSVVLDAGHSITLRASGNTTTGTVTASEGAGACMYPHFPAAGVPFTAQSYTGFNADGGSSTFVRTLHGYVEFIPEADLIPGSALATSLQSGDCAHLPDPAANFSDLYPPSGGLTATTTISGTLGTATVPAAGINSFTYVVLYTEPGSISPSLANGADPDGFTYSANVGGTAYTYGSGIDAVSALLMTTGLSAPLSAAAAGPANYLATNYPTKRLYTDPLYVASPVLPFLEIFGATTAGESCVTVDVLLDTPTPVKSHVCGQYLTTNLFELVPKAGNLAAYDLLRHVDPHSIDTSSVQTQVTTPGGHSVGINFFADAAGGTEGQLPGNPGILSGQPALAFVLSFHNPPAYQLVYAQQPSTVLVNGTMSPVKVQLRDVFGNVVTASTATVTLSLSGGTTGAILSGNSVKAVNGVATFSNLKVNQYGLGYKLTAASAGLAGVASNTFDAQAKLAFTTQPPANATAGTTINGTVAAVQMRDANGSALAGSPQITIKANPVAPIGGTTTAAAASGVATFSGLTFYTAGSGFTLLATGPGLINATSAPFNVTAGPADHLIFSPQPGNATVNVAMAPPVSVKIVDANGNQTASTVSVTVALGTNPGAATLSGTKTVSAVSGSAMFGNLVIDKQGTGYTLKASASGLPVVTSAVFDVVGDKIFASGFQ